MEPGRLVLRKLLDDPEKRKQVLKVLRKDHFLQPEEKYIFERLGDFNGQAITLSALKGYLDRRPLKPKPRQLLDRFIGDLAAMGSVLNSDYQMALDALVGDSRRELLYRRLQQAARMVSANKLDDAETIMRGATEEADSLRLEDTHLISARTMQTLDRKNNSERYTTGFTRFDELTGGGRRGEFWLWLAYWGELKSMALIHIAYSNFLRGKKVFYVTLEMDDDEVRQRLLARHSVFLGKELLYKEIDQGKAIRNGKRDLFLEVAKDFDTNQKYGEIAIYHPPLGATIDDVAKAFEIHASRNPDCGVLVLDYIQMLLPLRKRYQGRDEKNETLVRAKRLAMEVGSHGVWMISGYQSSSEGRKKAAERGKYEKWALSETIEAARAANVIIWSLYTDEMIEDKQVKVGLLKSRNTSRAKSIHYLVANPELSMLSSEPVGDDEVTPCDELSDLEELEV